MKKLIFMWAGLFVISLHAQHKPLHEGVSGIAFNNGFEPNVGQILTQSHQPVTGVIARIFQSGYSVYLTNKGVSVIMHSLTGRKENVFSDDEYGSVLYTRFDMETVGGTINPNSVVFENERPGFCNYFLPHIPDGAQNVKQYDIVRIKDVYPGIDWVWRSDSTLHHEFVVWPGSDPRMIQVHVKWADHEINDRGEVIYKTPAGIFRDGPLAVYESGENPVPAFVRIDEQGHIRFEVPEYNKGKVLTIDPPFQRLWATYYGGSGYDNFDGSTVESGSIAVDSAGCVYMAGLTLSVNFPIHNPGGSAYFQAANAGQSDIYIVKFSAQGERLWATYYGGSSNDYCLSLAVDRSGNVYATGNTFSTNFPVLDAGGGAYYQGSKSGSGDAYIIKFSGQGERLWATFYGGTMSDAGYCVQTDGAGQVIITGTTFSTNFPLLDAGNGAYYQSSHGGGILDMFIARFNAQGVRIWSTYYGGGDDDYGYAIATDSLNAVYITGYTLSSNFPTYNPGGVYFQGSLSGYRDAFILRFSQQGVREWATYYGGNGNDKAYSIASGGSGKIIITGETESTNLPLQDPGSGAYYQSAIGGSGDAFLASFHNGALYWATYYGGSSTGDVGRSVTMDASGSIRVSGSTLSDNFPTYDAGGGAYYQSARAGGHDAFLLAFSEQGVRQWATYYGGASTDIAKGITADGSENVWATGYTLSSAFPLFNPGNGAYFQETIGGQHDAFILKFEGLPMIAVHQQEKNIPDHAVLYPNYPNPFNSSTEITYQIHHAADVRLSIYNLLGQEVRVLFSGYQNSGLYRAYWDGKDDGGKTLPSGIYITRLKSGKEFQSRKICLMK